jgi:hypothetical protein
MSMYNLLHGQNPLSGLLKSFIDIDQENGKWSSGRFRDIYLNEDGTEIILYTSNGGGNREHWDDSTEAGPDCRCSGCVIERHLPQHPNYLRDWDDDFDCTYAYVAFSIPEEFAEPIKLLATGEKPETVHDKFLKTMEEMKGMTKEQVESDPRFKPLCDVLEKITGEAKT